MDGALSHPVASRPRLWSAAVGSVVIYAAFIIGCLQDGVLACDHPISNYSRTDSTSNATGTVSNYSCFAGFRFPGGAESTVFTCLANNTWSPSPNNLTCQWTCPPLSVGNATLFFSPPGAVAANVVAKCNRGYRYPDSASSKTTKCLGTGAWTVTLPAGCQAVQCPELDSKNSTPSTYLHEYPTEVNYTCDTDPEQLYFPDGAMWRVTACNEYGDWTQTIPPCVPYDALPKQAVQHEETQVEAAGAVSITTVLIAIIGTGLGVVVVLDLITFPRQFYFMKKNLHSRFPSCCKSVEQEEQEEEKTIVEDLISIRSAVTRSLSSLRNAKVTPSPSVADMDSIRGGGTGQMQAKDSDPLVNFLVAGGDVEGDGAAQTEDERVVINSRRRVASAKESVRRALEKTSLGKKLVKAVDKFSGKSLPLGSGSTSGPIGPPVATINEGFEGEEDEVYDDDDSDGSYTGSSEDDDEGDAGRKSHKSDIAVHEV